MAMHSVIDEDRYRRLSVVGNPNWEFCSVEGAAGVLGLVRPVHDPGTFHTNLIICRDEVLAAVELQDLAEASDRHMAASYDDVDLRGTEVANLGDAAALVTLRAFAIGPDARRVNQLQAIVDGGVDPLGGPEQTRVIYQLIATVAADRAEAYSNDIIDLVGGAMVEFAIPQ